MGASQHGACTYWTHCSVRALLPLLAGVPDSGSEGAVRIDVF